MKPPRSTRGWVALGLLLLGVAALWRPARRHLQAAALLADLTDGTRAEGVPVEELALAGVPARRYGASGPPVLLLHGVHPDGIAEPRLVRFASLLARAGFVVVTPELGALARVELDPRAPDAVGRAARALARREARTSVGVVGISFGGGLALVAAAEPDAAIGAVLALGAHHDAARVARSWLEPIRGPDGATPRAEPERYGPQVLAYAYADAYLEGAPDLEAARAVIGAMLRDEPEVVRTGVERLSPEARARVEPLRHGRALAPVTPELAALIDAHPRELAALSPAGRLRRVRGPVFLLHGERDRLIPASESEHLAAELPPSSLAAHLSSPLLGHADPRPARLLDQLAVVHLMARVLAAFEAL